MPKELYFIDSATGVKNNDLAIAAVDANYTNHSYNFYYTLRSPLRNITKITLKSVEIPLGASAPNNVRSNNLSNWFSQYSAFVLNHKFYVR